MAKNRESIFAEGDAAAREGKSGNPYKQGSWQFTAFHEGLLYGKSRQEDELALVASTPVAFPPRMPAATRQHVALLEARAVTTKNSTLALRLDRKITKLHQRWA